MDKSVEEFANKYSKEKFKDSKLISIDKYKIVIQCNKPKIKMAIPFYPEMEANEYSEFINDTKTFADFADYISEYIDYKELSTLNPKLKIFPNKGYKFGDAIEFLINYSVFDNEKGLSKGDDVTFDMNELFIDKVNVRISPPSDIFRIVFHEFEEDDYYTDWDDYTTVLLKGVNSDNFKDLLQQVLFWIYQICPSVYDIDFPEFSELHWESEVESEADYGEESKAKLIFKKEYDERNFAKSKHSEPIHFYNAAKRINDNDISFLYFYKVLEFYFVISQKESIKKMIEQYNANRNIDNFVEVMYKKYFGEKEEMLLKQMLNTLPSSFITTLCSEAYNKKLIIIDSIDEFTFTLYKYRNSIAHGKYDFKGLSLKIPDEIDNSDSKEWERIIEKIAFQLIQKYCYDK